MNSIYLDHAATTPVDPRVLEEMLPYLREQYGNPSSVHALGRRARHAVEESRERVAALMGAEPGEIVFTSGGTEADNAAIRGVIKETNKGILTSAAEHEAVIRTAEEVRREGRTVRFLAPGASGAVAVAALAEAIDEQVGLVSIMHANNEVGTLSEVGEVSALCARSGVLFHCDAVQTAGLYDVSPAALGADLITISSHKMYGPKGAGALFVRGDVPFVPLQKGGAQERGRRGGTENVAAIVGFAKAFELARMEREERGVHLRQLRMRLNDALASRFDGRIVFNSPLEEDRAVPHIVNVSFPPQDGVRIDGEMLLLNLDLEGIMASAGSACTSGAMEPSHVILSMGRDRMTASATVRFSAGNSTRPEDIDRTAEVLWKIYNRVRNGA